MENVQVVISTGKSTPSNTIFLTDPFTILANKVIGSIDTATGRPINAGRALPENTTKRCQDAGRSVFADRRNNTSSPLDGRVSLL